MLAFAVLVAFAPLRAEADVLVGPEIDCAEAHDLGRDMDDQAAHAGHGGHHAHGCGSCHFHAVEGEIAGAALRNDITYRRMLISNQEIDDADTSGQFRPPRI